MLTVNYLVFTLFDQIKYFYFCCHKYMHIRYIPTFHWIQNLKLLLHNFYYIGIRYYL